MLALEGGRESDACDSRSSLVNARLNLAEDSDALRALRAQMSPSPPSLTPWHGAARFEAPAEVAGSGPSPV
eukprot:CAMPEP_0202057198 /NCGR_PEP_ID=MMETSP0963-20130614/27367_1 /ASSEMBLY_ACC=CAM_ASM_000494 /TAXON_ID=4773 /ORGANISM="Schizochytrium aggregatum, Strain ATCC28209" /LENGTH=70 /DNA_ID=CAMNT_0048623019 /DNA_START=493 /DNA_END=703 /DNA_ORIENTATION=-